MSTEVIAIVVSTMTLLVTLGGGIFAGFAWMVRQMGGLRSELKVDIAELRTELKRDIAELRTEMKGDIAELRTELRADIAELRTELKSDIAAVRGELKGDNAEVRGELSEMRVDLAETKVAVARLDGKLDGWQPHLLLAH